MSKQLDVLLDGYIGKMTNTELQIADDSKETQIFILESAKSAIQNQIYDEIRAEIIDDALKDADKKIEQKVLDARLKEQKKLVFEGFLLAFLVGLCVNQITEIINFLKGDLVLESLHSTIIVSLILFGLCLVIFSYIFLKTLLDLLDARRRQNDETD